MTQNESIIWSKHDRHSRAFRTLTTDASKRIARNFGIDDATTSQVCLGCHADNVAPDAQGPLFDIADGVGCEVCHGGAIDWIGAHVDNLRSHENNLRLGLYPTVDPLARARLCASCHVQSAQLFVSHRLYGAGHPRLRFELDTFLVLQPMHARMDEDYILRKRPASNAKFWAVGQIVTAQALLGVMADPALTVDGRFPELALFDCQSCHHRTKDADDAAWRSSQKVLPRLDLSALILAAGIAEALAPDLAPDLIAGVETLRASGERSMTDVNRGAAQLARPISALLLRVQKLPFSATERDAVLRILLRRGRDGEYRDFSDAEQAIMAVASLVVASANDSPTGTAVTAAAAGLESLYEATGDQERFNAIALQDAMDRIMAACGTPCGIARN